jgi:two-component system LytT family sensor kinase
MIFPARTLLRVALSVVLWSAAGMFFALPALRQQGAWPGQLLESLCNWWAWGLLAPLFVAIDQRLPFAHGRWATRLASHLALSLVLVPAYVLLDVSLIALVGRGIWPWDMTLVSFASIVLQSFAWGLVVYLLIVGASHAYAALQWQMAAELRMEKLERSSSEARLHALRSQLDPHFVFNALNTVSSQITRDARLARQMIGHLGDLLRQSLESRARHQVTLQEELAFLEHYLAIQRIRFADRLRVSIDIPAQCMNALVPTLLLLPLVENAIRHGISPRASGGQVSISARQQHGLLILTVEDDGVGLPEGDVVMPGIGLSITRERIEATHPRDTTTLVVEPRPVGGTIVLVSFPFLGNGHGIDAAP